MPSQRICSLLKIKKCIGLKKKKKTKADILEEEFQMSSEK